MATSVHYQNPAKVDSCQWTGSNLAEFQAMINDPSYTYTVNADNSLTISNTPSGSYTIQIGGWITGTQYWGTSAGFVYNEHFATDSAFRDKYFA